MNANDPMLTAYALDELDPRERAQIEQLLRENPQAADEADDVRKVASMLNNTLRLEPAAGLSEEHREAVLRAAGVLHMKPAPQAVIEGPSWWRSWQFAATAAACMVFGFGAYAIFDALTESRPKYASEQPSKPGAMMIGVPTDDADTRYHQPGTDTAMSHPREIVGKPAQPYTASTDQRPPAGKLTVFSPAIDSELKPPPSLPEFPVVPEPATVVSTEKSPQIITPMGVKRFPGQQPLVQPTYGFSRTNAAPAAAPKSGSGSVSIAGAGLFQSTKERPVSTFPLPTSTASYAEVTAALRRKQLPPPESVRVDELVNFFTFDYALPVSGKPAALDLEVGICPWDAGHRLLRIGIRAKAGGSSQVMAEDVAMSVEFNPAAVASYCLIGYEGQTGAANGRSQTKLIAGGTATALYELIPAVSSETHLKSSTGLLTVKLNYVAPGSSSRRTIEASASDTSAGWLKTSDDFRWAASVATFGMLLRSESANDLANWKQLSQLFRNSSGGPRHEERTRFAAYVEKTIELVSARAASGGRK